MRSPWPTLRRCWRIVAMVGVGGCCRAVGCGPLPPEKVFDRGRVGGGGGGGGESIASDSSALLTASVYAQKKQRLELLSGLCPLTALLAG